MTTKEAIRIGFNHYAHGWDGVVWAGADPAMRNLPKRRRAALYAAWERGFNAARALYAASETPPA